ncbi:MAG: AMP-binding protein [Segniliparus sp.]|uniref:AMP-binding protein n=1 Tax=Segniliparus sp. TaxID=2804064 RepID=UPI003F344333
MHFAQDFGNVAARLINTAQNGLEVLRFGGFDIGHYESDHQIVDTKPMSQLRRYFPPGQRDAPRTAPVLLVPPLGVSADVYDISEHGAVTQLHEAGLDPWVLDFGSPSRSEQEMERSLSDHVLAVAQAVDLINKHTKQAPHLAGYSQGGMFCYQAAAYRRSAGIASVITFGSPVDVQAGLPLGLSGDSTSEVVEFIADNVLRRLAVPKWMVRTGFQMMDPVKSVRARVDFLRHLHDREVLLPRERQRRFLMSDGWLATSGPAIADFVKAFVVHNRMMTGGLVVNGTPVTLAEITCPVLAFVGGYDAIARPPTIRALPKVASRAAIWEKEIPAGHFGLVVGSLSEREVWPTVAAWARWQAGESAERPKDIQKMAAVAKKAAKQTRQANPGLLGLVQQGASILVEAGVRAGQDALDLGVQAGRTATAFAGEGTRAIPLLIRLGQLRPQTRVSLGLIMAEQARRAPREECFLFADRVHTHEAVGKRVDNVVRGLISVGVRHGDRVGVLMRTRPSALVAIAALNRLGAVAVLIPPWADLRQAVEATNAEAVISDITNLEAARGSGVAVLVLGVAESRDTSDLGQGVVDLEKVDPDKVSLPGWYTPNPGLAKDLAFILVTSAGGHLVPTPMTNQRWAVSAFGTATSASLSASDTVYCTSPLHHSAGLVVGWGGAVASGARIALSEYNDMSQNDPERFFEEVYRYGVTVVSYTWTQLRPVLDLVEKDRSPERRWPIRLFIGSGIPAGQWERVQALFAPARVVEFFASVQGGAVIANVRGVKPGSKGRPLPGAARVELGAYDAAEDELVLGKRGFVRRAKSGEPGVLIVKPTLEQESFLSRRGIFVQGDEWVITDHVFRRDEDGDFWLLDNRSSVIRDKDGPIWAQPVLDALDRIPAVDLAVLYRVKSGVRELAVAAVTLHPSARLRMADLQLGLGPLPPAQRPHLVRVVPEIPLSPTYRPLGHKLQAEGSPRPGRGIWCRDEDGVYAPFTAARARALGW